MEITNNLYPKISLFSVLRLDLNCLYCNIFIGYFIQLILIGSICNPFPTKRIFSCKFVNIMSKDHPFQLHNQSSSLPFLTHRNSWPVRLSKLQFQKPNMTKRPPLHPLRRWDKKISYITEDCFQLIRKQNLMKKPPLHPLTRWDKFVHLLLLNGEIYLRLTATQPVLV